MESTTVNIQIDPDTANVTQFTFATTDDATQAQLQDANIALGQTTFTVTAQRVPLLAGEACSYQIRTLYVDYTQNGLNTPQPTFPVSYQLYLSDLGTASPYVTLTAPPQLTSPADSSLPTSGTFICQTVPSATSYLLQVSTDPTFPSNSTYSALATGLSPGAAQANYSLQDLLNQFGGSSTQTIFWRMGARIGNLVFPFALASPNDDGWVFSSTWSFSLPANNPPVPAAKRKK